MIFIPTKNIRTKWDIEEGKNEMMIQTNPSKYFSKKTKQET